MGHINEKSLVVGDTPIMLAPANNARRGFKVVNQDGDDAVRIKVGAPPGTSDVAQAQTVTFSPAPTSGEWKLKYGALETGALAYNISSGNLQTALRLLAGLGSVTVSGDMTNGYVITMTSAPFPGPKLVVSSNTLVKAGTADVQTLTPSGTPAVGGFRIVRWKLVNGVRLEEKSPVIPYSANAAAIQDILRRAWNDWSLTVTGTYGTAFVVTSGDAKARETYDIQDNTLATYTVEVQTITLDDVPNAGSVKLVIDGQTTGALAYNASQSAIQTAIRALTGMGSVTVSGSFATEVEITFTGVPRSLPLVKFAENSLRVVSPEVQVIEFSAEPDAGDFKLTFGEEETAAIAFDDAAADVQTALRAIEGLEGVTVTGNFATGFEVTFDGVEGDVEMLGTADNSLEASEAPVDITVDEDTPGEDDVPVELEASEDTPGEPGGPVTFSTARTTPGVDPGAPAGSVAITAAGSSASDGESVAAEGELDKYNTFLTGAIYGVCESTKSATVKLYEQF